jgi:hypothetical protein
VSQSADLSCQSTPFWLGIFKRAENIISKRFFTMRRLGGKADIAQAMLAGDICG